MRKSLKGVSLDGSIRICRSTACLHLNFTDWSRPEAIAGLLLQQLITLHVAFFVSTAASF